MFGYESILFFILLFFIAICLKPLVDKTDIPFSIILLLIGYTGSEIATAVIGIDTGVRWYNFHTIIFNVFIPTLIFQSSLTINFHALKENIHSILIMAFPVMLLGIFLFSILIYFSINHATGFPWAAAIILSVLLSATDSSTVIPILEKAGISEKIKSLLQGESLFNDATAVLIFSIVLSIVTMDFNEESVWLYGIVSFVRIFAGGIVIGFLTGWMFRYLFDHIHSKILFSLLSLLFVYGTYFLSEKILYCSGAMSVLVMGMTFRSRFSHLQSDVYHFMKKFWEISALISEYLLFLMAGVTITIGMFTSQWLAMLFGIACLLISRLVSVTLVFSIPARFSNKSGMKWYEKRLLVWAGGVRGTLAIALALSLPISLEYFYTVQSIAYGIVIFTLFVQVITMTTAVRKFWFSSRS